MAIHTVIYPGSMRSAGGRRRYPRGGMRPPGRGPTVRPAAILARRTVNWINLGTPVGLIVALFGGARIRRGPYGLLIARGYRWPVPPVRGRAITIGDVVLLGL